MTATAKLREAARLGVLCAVALIVSVATGCHTRRSANRVFGMWIQYQTVHDDVRFADLAKKLDRDYVGVLRTRIPREIRPQIQFLHVPFSSGQGGAPPPAEQVGACLRAVRHLYDLFDARTAELVDLLTRKAFGSKALDAREQAHDPAKKYVGFIAALLHQRAGRIQADATFALGNRFFEFAFYPPTSAKLRALVSRADTRPIARMLFEGIALALARQGWLDWHAETLAALKAKHDAGHEIVYIAGGTDLYQLLRRGIYNVRIIDPMLPTQAEFYGEGWEYLIRGKGADGGLGDQIVFPPGVGPARMRRTSFKEEGVLVIDRRTRLPKSTTVWTFEDESGKALGRFVLERRFTSQWDFRLVPRKTLLISFNELHFVAVPGKGGWGIDVSKFPPELPLYVKQLRRPVNRSILLNLRRVAYSALPFAFGSAVE